MTNARAVAAFRPRCRVARSEKFAIESSQRRAGLMCWIGENWEHLRLRPPRPRSVSPKKLQQLGRRLGSLIALPTRSQAPIVCWSRSWQFAIACRPSPPSAAWLRVVADAARGMFHVLLFGIGSMLGIGGLSAVIAVPLAVSRDGSSGPIVERKEAWA
jgi:hypothetical protein